MRVDDVHLDLLTFASKEQHIRVERLGYPLAVKHAIGFKAWDTIIVEVKVSRADFLKDKAQRVRMTPSQGMGRLRYYLCPVGLIAPDEVPEKWGLLYTDEKRITEVKQAYFQDSAKDCERSMAVSVISAFSRAAPISVKSYIVANLVTRSTA